MAAQLIAALRHTARHTASRLTGRSPFSHTVFLAGSGRSGTTWVGNLINHRNDHRVLFEPIHHERVPEFAGFSNRQYLRAADTRRAYSDPVRRLLQGRVHNAWSDAQNTNPFATRLLIKDIRANLLLHWLKAQFPETRIVLLLRHPFAVALSRVKLGWKPFADAFLAQPDLMADVLEPFRDLLEAPHSDFLGNVVCWCAENYVPLTLCSPDALHVCYYEQFLIAPQAEVARLMAFAGGPPPEDLNAALASTSHTNWNRPGQAAHSFDEWISEITEHDRRAGRAILERFGMDQFFSPGGSPLSPVFER